MVVLVLPALVLEAGIANVPDYFLDEDKGRFDFRDGNPEPVVCPVNYLNLIFWPKGFQWIYDPGLYLKAVGQGVVLYHADEAVLGENPHSGHLHTGRLERDLFLVPWLIGYDYCVWVNLQVYPGFLEGED